MRDFLEMAVDLDVPPPKITVPNATPSQGSDLTTLPLIKAETSDKQVMKANQGHSDQELYPRPGVLQFKYSSDEDKQLQ